MPTLERLDAAAVRAVVARFRDAVRDHAPGLNRLNVYPVPDGDTGTNMARTLEAVVAEVEQADPAMTPTCKAISHGSLMGARGNSGVILSQILRGLASTIEAAGEATAATLATGLRAAADAAYAAVLKPMEGTILTVVREVADAAERAVSEGADLVALLDRARDEGRASLARTPDLLPVLRDAGVVDAGGAGFLLLIDAALSVVAGRPLPEPDEGDGPDAAALAAVAHRHGDAGALDVSEQRYEVMYFLDLVDDRIGEFKSGWGAIGDSIVVVGGEGLWNCHVHTNDIGAALEVALDLGGRPRQIRVTDLFEEVAEEHDRREAAIHHRATHDPATAGLPAVTTAVVAVTAGQGLIELFGQLGVQGVVTGGQTMNPSTAELLAAVEAVNAQQVVVLPNNKNIIPVAEQLGALTTKTVVVVPTRSMPEGLAALVVYDPEADAEHNRVEMAGAAGHVVTGEVTRAVRDAASSAGPVTTGDWIGLAKGEGIVAVGGSVTGAATALLDALVTPERELVTIILGEDATRDATDAVVGWLADNRQGVEVEVHRGGQPLYPYLFGIE
jgi:DAK2 domain fusion protein YloV